MKARRFVMQMIQAATFTIVLAACSPQVDWNGQFPTPETLAKIEPGKSSRGAVLSLLGGPSSRTVVNDDIWYCIGQKTERIAFLPPKIIQRNVIYIAFDAADRVESIGTLDLDDGKKIVFVDRTTPTAGQRITILQQLIGNLGRFAPQEQ